MFADAETLFVTLPGGTCGVTFQANLDQSWSDRRGGILRMTGDIRRNVAYTTNAHIVQNEMEPIGTATHRIRLIVQSDGTAALLINITPRLGFNRYIRQFRGNDRSGGPTLARLVCGGPGGK